MSVTVGVVDRLALNKLALHGGVVKKAVNSAVNDSDGHYAISK